MDRVSRPRYYVPRSQPVGLILRRPDRKVRFGQRMKPRSWQSDTFWFRSALFKRGTASRKIRFAGIMSSVRP